MSANPESYVGAQDIYSGSSEYNALAFTIAQILNTKNHATLVRIVAVSNDGDVTPVGYVDVLPLVNQIDGEGNARSHAVIHNVPYFRMQGGSDAIILDPKVGDIGMAAFADRDISAVKAAKQQANPGSMRQSDMADGMYFGGFLNGTPTQYIRFSAAGVDIVSPTKITLSAPLVEVDAGTSFTVNSPQSNFSGMVVIQGLLSWLSGMTGSGGGATSALITGVIRFVGSVFANGKHIDDTHTHGGVQSGTSNTSSVN